MQLFNASKSVDLTDGDLMKHPSISLRSADPEGANKIIGTLKWMEKQLERPA